MFGVGYFGSLRCLVAGCMLFGMFCLTNQQERPNPVKPPCKSNAHVCTSLLRYPDGSEYDEGPYCKCPGCSSTWETNDFKSLSWPHYERADRTVQYKFCVPIIPKRTCADDDLAVTMSTTTGDWSPHIREARCACPGHMYQLLGWWRYPMTKHDNRTGLWIYEYSCKKPDCVDTETPCAKIYINQHTSNDVVTIIGYIFQCACPKGYKCPDTDIEDASEEHVEKDSRGSFVARYCDAIHKGAGARDKGALYKGAGARDREAL